MKSIFTIIALGSLLSGCGATAPRTVFNEWYNTNINQTGFTSYDPPNGQWTFISNEPGMDHLKRTQDWDIESGKRPVY